MNNLSNKIPIIEGIIDEVVALFHRLQDVAVRIHSGTGPTASERGVLRSLDRLGPQTVPQMARARPVSRQYIQAVVNHLMKQGLVDRIPNPAHKRSPLIKLTDKGQDLIAAMTEMEAVFLAELDFPEDEADLRAVLSVLRKLKSSLDNVRQGQESYGRLNNKGELK